VLVGMRCRLGCGVRWPPAGRPGKVAPAHVAAARMPPRRATAKARCICTRRCIVCVAYAVVAWEDAVAALLLQWSAHPRAACIHRIAALAR
jgi:hypothetical protein